MSDPLSLRVPISPDALIEANQIGDAVKASRRELRELSREIDEAILKYGSATDAQLERYEHLKSTEERARRQLEKQKTDAIQNREVSDLKRDVKLLENISRLRAISNIAQGNFNPGDVVQLLQTKSGEQLLKRFGLKDAEQFAGNLNFAIGVGMTIYNEIAPRIEKYLKKDEEEAKALSAYLSASRGAGVDPEMSHRIRGDVHDPKQALARLNLFVQGKRLGLSDEDAQGLSRYDPSVTERLIAGRRATKLGEWLDDILSKHPGSMAYHLARHFSADERDRAVTEILEERVKTEAQRRADRRASMTATERFEEFAQSDFLAKQQRENILRHGGQASIETARFLD